MSHIYHIASEFEWARVHATGMYAAASLTTEGFIHCSTATQVVGTADRLFKGQRGLVLLCIDSAAVSAAIRYENLEGGAERFPHVYGELEISAIVAAHDFRPREDGSFELPPGLRRP
jgi:uncharacterized protein (DUF952 family)